MAKLELGLKRICGACSAKFYDLNKSPIVCPKCSTVFEVLAAPPSRPRAETSAARPAAPVARDEEEVVADEADVELVSLEDADDDAVGKNSDADIDLEDDIDDDDDTFLEEEEEEDDDVSDLIGDGIDDDEES